MQTDYNKYMDESFPGMIVDSYRPRNIKSRAIEESEGIDFGLGVVKGTDVALQVALPYSEIATLVFDADIVTGNSIDGKVNGNAITTVPFNTDHDTTMDDLVTELEALDGVSAELTDEAGDNRTVKITVDHTDAAHLDQDALLADWAVTGGASQAGIAITYSTEDQFTGVLKHEHKMSRTLRNVDQFTNNQESKAFNKEAGNILDEGMIWVYVTEAVAIDDTAYLIATGANRGKFSKTSAATSIDSTGKFKSATSGAGLAKLKIRLL